MRWAWLEEKSKSWRRYPIALIGFVRGPLRFETIGGGSFCQPSGNWPLVFERPASYTVGPVLMSASTPYPLYAVTHLQKKSRFGFLLAWPLCFHIWITFRFQQQKKSDGDVMVDVPGSERVLYWRVGFGRWDAHDGIYICPTWYGPGLHWD